MDSSAGTTDCVPPITLMTHPAHPMSFRQPKSDKHHADEAWNRWIDQHRAEMKAMGLSPEVYLSESHWQDFLANGHLHWHPQDSTRFTENDLPPPAIAALRRFLELQYGHSDPIPALLGWLRARAIDN
jgi:hypothetical protein